ncbi:bactericidal permeability-increasing [Stylonychia lemnae]|uniref:Bactericidal permeability-increasing n=1 Tax=Stylonychia lemnae TaxID=5949 RepID=A0A078ACJ9_STYLE|nr:bactericidal permeability-increasing [Stylonychia lemnae]|eukprot:CDW79591.1 bactericidal permeability-increasing [Stylonychia lemnae]
MRILKSSLLLVSLICLANEAICNLAGTAAGVDIGIVDQVKKIGMPIIQQQLNDFKVGKINFKGGDVDNMDLKFSFNNPDSIKVAFSGASNAINVQANDISGEITGRFHYKLLFIHASGKFKVKMNNDAVKLSMNVPLVSQTIDGRNIPAIGINDFDLHIDSSKIHITLSGSFIADIADAFVDIFKKLIIKEINKAINSAVPKLVISSINKIFKDTNGRAKVYKDMQFDFTFVSNPVISDSNLALYLNATLYDSVNGYKIPAIPLSDVQILNPSTNSVELSVSHFTADSLFIALQEQNLFQYYLDASKSGKLSSMLTTTYLEGLLPGIEAKYGKDVPVSVDFKSSSAPRALFQKDDFGLIADLDLTFIVQNQTAIIVSLKDFQSTVIVALQGQNLSVQIQQCQINDVSASQSQIGYFSAYDFKLFFNVASRIAVPIINNMFLENPFVLPSTILGMIHIDDAKFQSFDNYLAVNVSPQFITA